MPCLYGCVPQRSEALNSPTTSLLRRSGKPQKNKKHLIVINTLVNNKAINMKKYLENTFFIPFEPIVVPDEQLIDGSKCQDTKY